MNDRRSRDSLPRLTSVLGVEISPEMASELDALLKAAGIEDGVQAIVRLDPMALAIARSHLEEQDEDQS